MKYQSGRHRWVKYANLADYNASQIPREWHGWLHHVDNEPGLKAYAAPMYEVPAVASNTGKPTAYVPKGHFKHPKGIKSWQRYQAWVPPGGR